MVARTPSSACAVFFFLSQVAAQNGEPVGGGSSNEQVVQQTQVTMPGISDLTITGEYRIRYENQYNYDLTSSATDDNDFFTQRFRLNFAMEFNDDLDGYFQIQDVRNWGVEPSTVSAAAPGLDIHRAWVRLKDMPTIGGSGKIGRQVLSFGDDRLIGHLEWVSQARAFDGYRHTWKKDGSYTLDAFLTQVTETAVTSLHDDSYFLGAYYTMESLKDSNTELDLYVLHLQDEETLAGGTENRTTIGARVEKKMSDSVEIGAELATQFGDVNNADIPIAETYAFHTHGTMRFGEGNNTWVRAEINGASGNDPNSNDNERFNNLFPTAHRHWGMMDLAFWENMLHGMVQFGMNLDDRSKVSANWHIFRSVEETDRFAGPANTFAGTAAGTSNSIGNEIDLIYHKIFDTEPVESYVQFGYGLFLPGSGAEVAAGNSDHAAHFIYAMAGLRF